MPQLFHPRVNSIIRFGTLIVLGMIALLLFAWVRADWSPWSTREDVVIQQPIPFSHEHHVSGLGIDCRYCHSTVEEASSAGMPSTHTCMSCHSQVWTEAPVLEPVRRSYRTGQPIRWVRVYDLPDYVYFDHSIHVSKGVGCETCHGRVDQMPLMRKESTLFMEWCLDCHRAPEEHIRPKEFIFAFGYDLPADRQRHVGRRLVREYDIHTEQLTDCSICHR